MKELMVPIFVTGSITALVALSFQLIFRVTGVIVDFAVGQYVVLAGMGSAFLANQAGLPLSVVVPCGIAFSATAALISEMGAIRPLSRLYRNIGAFGPVLGTVTLLWIWEQAARLLFGDRPLRGEQFFADSRLVFAGMRLSAHQLIIMVSAIVTLLAIHGWLEYSKSGRLLRAVGDNPHASEILGLEIRKARTLGFFVGGIIAGFAGILAGPLSGLAPLTGIPFLANGFVALFLGGASNTWGAAVGGLLLAAINILVSRYLGAAWKDYSVLLLALIIFGARPQGIIAPMKRRPS